MKIILCTTPIRPVPTNFPPVGCTSLMELMVEAGYDPFFYDIDGTRPSFEEVVEFFKREQPDFVGISAVVSTSYRYTKQLSHAIRKVCPQAKIILGGNLAASSEILLRKCAIDVSVIGEGDRVLLNLLRHIERFGDFKPRPELHQIKGISFLNEQDQMVFTGYEAPVPADELREPNYDLLEKYSNINTFIVDPMENSYLVRDPRAHQPHRKGKMCASLMTAKGCVARCTFCHRWDKGYRTHNVDKIIKSMKHLMEKYNVGFFTLNDENFGSDYRQVKAFVEAVKPLDVLFTVGGIRVTTICKHPEMVRELKEAGCVMMNCGMEAGSPKILNVMEKAATLEQNLKAAEILKKEDMFTMIQLVVGMPGENDQTIEETLDFAKRCTEDMPHVPWERLSVNYFQALPGTPGYEFMRSKGLIGSTLEDEEAYLLKISDVDASSWEHYVNCTEVPTERVMLWGPRIIRECMIHYMKRRNWKAVDDSYFLNGGLKDFNRGSYFRVLKPGRFSGPTYWYLYDKFGWLIDAARLFKTRKIVHGLGKAILLTLRLLPEEDRSRFKTPDDKSLRKIVALPKPEEVQNLSEASMIPLRAGR